MDNSAGAAALGALDTILAQAPEPDQDLFSKCVHCLSVFRNALIEAGQRRYLEHVNAVISVVMAGHFPLGQVPWDELEKSRLWLAQAVEGLAAEAGGPG